MKFKDIIYLILAAAFFILLFQNTQVVSINFLVWKVSMSKIILILFSVMAAFIIGFIVGKKYW